MKLQGIKTHRIQISESIENVCDTYLSDFALENSILAITTKIISLCEGRVISKNDVAKEDLIIQEAEKVLEKNQKFNLYLTKVHGVTIPSAGIDESNANKSFILYPKDPFKTVRKIHAYLCHKYNLNNFGVILTDSRSMPFRQGVMGFGLAWSGFKALKDYRGKNDLDGTPLKHTQSNILDSLASAAVLIMGEANEQIPMVLIQEVPSITFDLESPTQLEIEQLNLSPEEDLYYCLVKGKDILENLDK